MKVIVKQKQPLLPISIVLCSTFKHGGCMITIGKYGSNILRRTGRWYSIKGLRKTSSYKLAQRVGTMNKLGPVKAVFSKRRNDRTVIALVTNDIPGICCFLPPISQLKSHMHRIVWNQEVQNVIKVSHDKKVIRRLEKQLAA